MKVWLKMNWFKIIFTAQHNKEEVLQEKLSYWWDYGTLIEGFVHELQSTILISKYQIF